MERQSTKYRILDEALNLFSENGYNAVSVEKIAAAVGIKAPSLYKHYKSKQEIFNAILDEMQNRYTEQTERLQISGENAEIDGYIYQNISENDLIKIGKDLFLYFLHDEYVRKFRKMLTVEQYRNSRLAAIYTEQYFDGPLSYQGMLLELLAQNGMLKQENPNITALHFYAPIYMLLTLCDRQPEREEVALQILSQHIKQFNRLYKNSEE